MRKHELVIVSFLFNFGNFVSESNSGKKNSDSPKIVTLALLHGLYFSHVLSHTTLRNTSIFAAVHFSLQLSSERPKRQEVHLDFFFQVCIRVNKGAVNCAWTITVVRHFRTDCCSAFPMDAC